MKTLIAVLAMTSSIVVSAGEWTINEKNVAVTFAETTKDVLGVDLCSKAIILAAPVSSEGKEGDTYPINASMRIDTLSPWQMKVTAYVSNGIIMSVLKMSPQLLSELVQGKTMRIKWDEDSFSRFDLAGLTSTLSTLKCDDDFFPESDSDYFL